METKHTPGPWHRNIKPASKYPTIFAGRNTHICQVDTRSGSPETIEANIDIITAAPDLLKACKMLVDSILNPDRMGAGHVVDLAEKAIAKAEGR